MLLWHICVQASVKTLKCFNDITFESVVHYCVGYRLIDIHDQVFSKYISLAILWSAVCMMLTDI